MNASIVQQASPVNPFDSIRRARPDGSEFWSARDLMPLLGYSTWRNFSESIDRAGAACRNSGISSSHHFADASKVINTGKGAKQTLRDFHLTRYAAYLIAMNGDPRKFEIASAQTYFAQQTRRAEIAQALPSPDFTHLEALAGLTARAISNQAEITKAEIRVEMAEQIGSLPATSEQQHEVKLLVRQVVGGRQRLGLSNSIFALVYRECWDACKIGSIRVMTRDQYPQAEAYLRAELARLASLGDSGLFTDEPVLTRGASA